MGANVRVHRLSHDRVSKLQPLRRLQDCERREEIGGAGRFRPVDVGQTSRIRQAGAVTEYRDGAHQGGRRSGRSREAQQDRLRHRGGPDALHTNRLAGFHREPLLAGLA
jgi:hypothetical protein